MDLTWDTNGLLMGYPRANHIGFTWVADGLHMAPSVCHHGIVTGNPWATHSSAHGLPVGKVMGYPWDDKRCPAIHGVGSLVSRDNKQRQPPKPNPNQIQITY